MMRRVLTGLTALAFLLFTACGDGKPVQTTTTATAATTTVTTTVATTETTTTTATTAPTTTTQPENTDSNSQSSEKAVRLGLYRADGLAVVYEQAAADRLYPASLTKIATAYTALRYVSPDTVFTVGSEQELVKKGSSLCLIKQGHRLTLYDLLTGMLMASGNDAAYTVAVNVARLVADDPAMTDAQAVEYFCKLMNSTVRGMGATDTHFVNPDGWDDDRQYSTVRDLALITAHALQSEEIGTIVATVQKRVVFASGQIAEWKNTNALLYSDNPYYDPTATGFKTGSTSKAGKCLIATVQRGGSTYIAVVTGCETNDDRYLTMLDLLKKIP